MGLLVETEVPSNVRAVIEAQCERLTPDELGVLEGASVAGVEFSAAAVAGVLGSDVVDVDRVCEALTRRHRFLEPAGAAEWPDGTLATQYRFLHELYHNVVSGRVPAARRAQMHRALADRLELAWAPRPGDHAAELALHFEHGRDFRRAIRYLQAAAEGATRQYAHREAADYLGRAVAALDRLPADERAPVELPLLTRLGVNLRVTLGCAAPEIRRVHERAREVCRTVADARATFPALWGIWVFHKVRSELREAEDLAARLLAIARELDDPALLLQAYQAVSVTALCAGDPGLTVAQMDLAAAIYDPAAHARNTHDFGQDPGVATLAFGGVGLWLVGREEDAVRASDRAVALARDLAQPSSLALSLHFAAMLHQLRGDLGACDRDAHACLDLAAWEGFRFWHAGATVLRGWVAAADGHAAEGFADLHRGIDAWLATGSRTYHTYHLGLLAESLLRHGRAAEARATLDAALTAARDMPEGLYEAELHRLRGQCLLHAGAISNAAEARACFEAARDVAHRQGARPFETRAARLLD